MGKQIKKENIFESGLFSDVVQGAKNLSTELQNVRESAKESASDIKTIVESLKGISAKNITTLDKSLKAAKKTVEQNAKAGQELTRVQKEEERLLAKLSDLSDDNAKSNIKLRKTIQDNTKATKELVTIEEELGKEYDSIEDAIENLDKVQFRNVNTIKEAQEQNKALRIIVRNLNAEIPEQAEQINRLNGIIDSNTELQKGNSDSLVQSKINIGNYTESIKDALQSSGLFGGELSVLSDLIGDLTGLMERATKNADQVADSTENAGKAAQASGRRFKAFNNILKGSVIFAVVAAVVSLGAAFTSGRAGAIRLEKATAVLTETVKGLVNLLSQVGSGLIVLFTGLGAEIVNFGKVILAGAVAPVTVLINILDKLNAIAREFGVETGEIGNKLSGLKDELNDFVSDGLSGTTKIGDGFGDVSTGLDRIIEAFKTIPNLINGVSDSIDSAFSNIDKRFDIQDRISLLRLEIAGLNGELSVLEQRADDSTVSLERRSQAARQAAEIQRELAKNQVEQAKLETELQVTAIEQELQRNKAFFQGNESRKAAFNELLALSAKENKSQEDLIAFTEKFTQLQLDINEIAENSQLPAQFEELTAATENLITVSGEAQAQEGASQQKRLEIERDIFEQRLDFLIDVTDRNKQLQEQQVQDTRLSIDERKRIFDELTKNFASNIESQEKELNKLGDQIEKITGDNVQDIDFQFDEEGLKFFIDGVEQSTDDIVGLNDALQQTGFDEITINRIREIIQEAKAGQKDFNDLNKELDETEQTIKTISESTLITEEEIVKARKFNEDFQKFLDANQDLSSLNSTQLQEVLRQQETFNERREEEEREFQNKRLELEKKQLQERISLLDENSKDRVELEQELANIELEINKRKNEQISDELQKQLAEREEFERQVREAIQTTTEIASNLNERITKRRIDGIQSEIDAIEARESRLQELADQGVQGAAETLQNEQRLRAQAEVQKQREQEAAARRELVIAGIRALAENPDQTISEILVKLAALPQAVNAIPLPVGGFYEGTEHVGKALSGQESFKGKDGYLGQTKTGKLFRFDGEERIINPSQNRLIGAMSNDELTSLADMANKGLLTMKTDVVHSTNYISNSEVLRKFDILTNEVQKVNGRQQAIEIYWDSIEQAYVQKTKTLNKLHTKHTKTGGIWGR